MKDDLLQHLLALKENKLEAKSMIDYYNKLIKSYMDEVESLDIAIPALENAVIALQEKMK